jgi:thiamine biosynthesis protein ThiI
MTTYLLKLGELTLKGGNRRSFERILKQNLLSRLRGTAVQVETSNGRFFVRCESPAHGLVENALARLFGITGWAKARLIEKTPESLIRGCVEEARELYEKGIRTFKIEARRTDKRFPLDSYQICRVCGAAVCDALEGLAVDVHNPQGRIEVEIREKGYVYASAQKGLRGLPVGTAGRGLLLLSGGIDSPVAGYLMASRGMRIDGLYFHAYPYTPEEAREKVVRLGEIVGAYALGIRLYILSFTEIQRRIQEKAPEPWFTVLLRRAMMECAETLGRYVGAKCLITGESLSQVASQTIENITCTESRIGLPVLRPLIGLDKEGIIGLSKRIGAYDVSILPYQDCCVLFSPPHPVLRGDPEEASRLYEALELDGLIEQALRERQIVKCGFPEGV